MKKTLCILGPILMLVIVAQAYVDQKADADPQYPFKAKKSVAEAIFADKTFDEVWGATLRVIITELQCSIKTNEKESGLISAVRNKGSLSLHNNYSIDVVVEQKEGGVSVTCHWAEHKEVEIQLTDTSYRKKTFKAFFNGIAKKLYDNKSN